MFRVPQSPAKNVLTISEFKGVDLYNAPANVEHCRSPQAPNMIRDVPGKVRKRMGFYTVKRFMGSINGIFYLRDKVLVHAGPHLYLMNRGEEEGGTIDNTSLPIYTKMNNERSKAWEMNGFLYLQDGKQFLVFGEFEKSGTKEYAIKLVSEIAYIPTIIISRNPNGGGTTLEPVNLLQSKWRESFLCQASLTVYQLTAGDLDDTPVTAKKLLADGAWKELLEKTDFTVDRKRGQLKFVTAPGLSPITGQDNLIITASKKREGYQDRINQCSVSILYGVNGAADRLFVSGNSAFPNRDWYSQMSDPTYFGDLWYTILGQDGSGVLGYSIINDKLAAHKDEGEDGRNVILRQGVLVDNKAAFPIIGSLQGKGAIAKHSFAYLSTEPLFLTELGIMAITAADITGEKYSQNRSFYINKQLNSEATKKDAFGFTYRDFYLLAVDERVYILDGLQKTYERGAPYSTYQYECYYWENLGARIFWEKDGKLYFGSQYGELNCFYNDPENPLSYQDKGKAIEAYWDIPDIDGSHFFQNKTFRRISVRLASALATGVKIKAQKRGIWYEIADAQAKARYLDFSAVNFEKFAFSSDQTPKTINTKIRVKKVDKVRFRLENNQKNEPFGIYSVAFTFSEQGMFQ